MEKFVEEWLPTESLFHLRKCCLALLHPLDQICGTLSGEICQRAETRHELVMVPHQAQELPHLLLGLGARGGYNGSCLLHLCTRLPTPQVVTKILYFPPSKWTFLRVCPEPCLPQSLQDRNHLLHMLRPGATVDDNI